MIIYIILAFLALLYIVLSPDLFTTLNRIPNAHWSVPYSRLWLFWLKFKGKEHRTRYALHSKLGPVIRLGPKELSVNCIENGVKTVYNTHWDKGTWYKHMNNFGYKYLFATIEEKAHRERKRMIAHLFCASVALDSPELDESLNDLLFNRLLPQISKWSHHDTIVNVLRECKAFCMDATNAFIFGPNKGSNFIENMDSKDCIAAFEIAGEGHFWLSEMYTVSKLLEILGFQFMNKEQIKGLARFEAQVLWECKVAKENMTLSGKYEPEHTTVYAQFRRALERNSSVRDEDIDMLIAAETWDMLHAGNENPGITLAYLMAELSKNPIALGLLMRELKNLRIWHDREGMLPPAKEINKLEYLNAIIWETMRLYPSALGPFPRVVPSAPRVEGGDSKVASHIRLGEFEDIPPGTNVSVSAYSLHRNPDIFEDPEVWRPERWLDGKVPRSEMKKWWWAFGSGTRICIGNHLSFRMMKAFVVAVYGEFDPNLVAPVEEQTDGPLGGPGGNKVLMKFYHSPQ